MAVIPAALDGDVEDVSWALQTAEALWRRDERVDAIVWLRRAAQAAGEEGDDDRALFLARHAAELSEWLAHNQGEDPPLPSGAPPPESEASKSSLGPVDDLLAAPSVPAQAALPQFDEGTGELEPPVSLAEPLDSSEDAPSAHEAHKGMFDPWSEQAAHEDGGRRSTSEASPPGERVASDRAAGEQENFGDDEVVTSASFVAAEPVGVPPLPKMPMAPAARTPEDDDQVLEGIGMAAALKEMRDSQRAPRLQSQPSEDEVTANPPVVAPPLPRAAPPMPPRAKPPLPKPGPPRPPLPKLPPPKPHAPRAPAPPTFVPEEAPTLAREVREEEQEPQTVEPPTLEPATPKRAASEPPPAPAISEPELAPEPAAPEPAREPEPVAAYAHPADGPLGLDDVESFADLPDDARAELASVATISTLGKDEEVSGFALAFVMNGEVDVAATIVDAPAARLHAGAVLRTRGTVGEGMALRLIGTDAEARVASWPQGAVEAAFKTCPWVEDDLRAAADRMQAMVGITMGQIADRLDPSLRQSLTDRLEVRTLGPGEILVEKGKPLPGLVLVGVGLVEVVDGDAIHSEVGPGDFLFATEILGGGAAPATARAGSEGAVYLFADRKVAQEMLVTVPPLLEIFAGM